MACTFGDMTLAEYLSETGTKDEAFAAMIGVSRSMVTKLRNRSAKPSADTALKIIAITGPKVGLADLMPIDIPTPTGAAA